MRVPVFGWFMPFFCLFSNLGNVQTWSKCNRPLSKTHYEKERKKKALHRGTFEVVTFFSFQCLAPERGRESACARVLPCARAEDVAVQGHLSVQAPCAGTSVCWSRCWQLAHVWLCTCPWPRSRPQPVAREGLWLLRGHMSLCQGSPRELQWSFQGPCLGSPLAVTLLGLIL